MAAKYVEDYVTALVNTQYRKSNEEQIVFVKDLPIDCNSLNGIELNGVCLPEEVLIQILSYLHPSAILRCSLVCKYWHRIARSNIVWQEIYNDREFPKKAKNWPWYVFYLYFSTNWFKNMIINGNGQMIEKGNSKRKFIHWFIVSGEDMILVEDPPVGCEPLPSNLSEFNGHTSCFATSYLPCTKYQLIRTTKLLRYVVKHHRPTLYASEWFAGRFDCGCLYKLALFFNLVTDPQNARCDFDPTNDHTYLCSGDFVHNVKDLPATRAGGGQIAQWEGGKTWKKVEIFCDDYPSNLEKIYFSDHGQDTQFWRGNYGAKMAGGVLRFVLESIEPITNDDNYSEENI